MKKCDLTQTADRFKVLANPVRLRILALLRREELCVCQIVSTLGTANSTVSEHLQALRQAGFISERKAGRWVHYSLAPEDGLQELLDALWGSLDGSSVVARDREALETLLREPLEVVCARTRSRRAAS